MTRSRNKAKTAKKAGVEAEAKREAAGVVRPGAKTPAKAVAKAGSQADSVAETKAVSKNKVVIEMKERSLANFSPKAEDAATGVSWFRCVAEASAESRSMRKDKAGIGACSWAGEETRVGSGFWTGEETGDRSRAKDEERADPGPPSCAGKLEPVVAGASCKARPGAYLSQRLILSFIK